MNVERKNPELYLVVQTDDGSVDDLKKLLNDNPYNGYKVFQVVPNVTSKGHCYTVIFKWDQRRK